MITHAKLQIDLPRNTDQAPAQAAYGGGGQREVCGGQERGVAPHIRSVGGGIAGRARPRTQFARRKEAAGLEARAAALAALQAKGGGGGGRPRVRRRDEAPGGPRLLAQTLASELARHR